MRGRSKCLIWSFSDLSYPRPVGSKNYGPESHRSCESVRVRPGAWIACG